MVIRVRSFFVFIASSYHIRRSHLAYFNSGCGGGGGMCLKVFNLELGLAAARGDLGVFVGSVEVEELGGAVVPVADYFISIIHSIRIEVKVTYPTNRRNPSAPTRSGWIRRA